MYLFPGTCLAAPLRPAPLASALLSHLPANALELLLTHRSRFCLQLAREACHEGGFWETGFTSSPSFVGGSQFSELRCQVKPVLFFQHLCLRIFLVQLSIYVRFVLLGVKLAPLNLHAPCFPAPLRPFLDLLVLARQILLCVLHLVKFFTAKSMLLVPSSAILRATATRSRPPAPSHTFGRLPLETPLTAWPVLRATSVGEHNSGDTAEVSQDLRPLARRQKNKFKLQSCTPQVDDPVARADPRPRRAECRT